MTRRTVLPLVVLILVVSVPALAVPEWAVLGRWKGDQPGGWSHTLTLKKRGEEFMMVDQILATRSGERATMEYRLKKLEDRYRGIADHYKVLDNRFGEYFLVYDSGTVEAKDTEGIIYTAHKLE